MTDTLALSISQPCHYHPCVQSITTANFYI